MVIMENNIQKISVYGDSILKGAVTGLESGHLFDIIEDNSMALAQKALGFELNNQSVFGNIVTKSQRKLARDIEKGVVGDIAILESGGNDCDYDWSVVCADPEAPHDPRVPLSEFLEIFENMIKACRENKITPVMMTMPALVQDRWYEHICSSYDRAAVEKFTGAQADVLYHNHEIYNFHLIALAHRLNVQLVDMRLALLSNPKWRDLMCLDGIHPNQEGYHFMAEVWKKEIPGLKKEF